MPQLSEFLLIQLNCVVAVEQVLYVFSLLKHAPTDYCVSLGSPARLKLQLVYSLQPCLPTPEQVLPVARL